MDRSDQMALELHRRSPFNPLLAAGFFLLFVFFFSTFVDVVLLPLFPPPLHPRPELLKHNAFSLACLSLTCKHSFHSKLLWPTRFFLFLYVPPPYPIPLTEKIKGRIGPRLMCFTPEAKCIGSAGTCRPALLRFLKIHILQRGKQNDSKPFPFPHPAPTSLQMQPRNDCL